MLSLILLAWLLALGASTSLFAVVVLLQVLTRRLRHVTTHSPHVVPERVVAGTASPVPVTAQAA